MSYSAYSYAIALGFDVALVSLVNVQALLWPHNRVTSADAPANVSIVSASVDPFPVRIQTLDTQESGDGILYLTWNMTLNTLGIKFWMDTFFASETVLSTAVTIYTRRTELNSYSRYNAYMIMPSITGGDLAYTHTRGRFLLKQRFNDLVPSS